MADLAAIERLVSQTLCIFTHSIGELVHLDDSISFELPEQGPIHCCSTDIVDALNTCYITSFSLSRVHCVSCCCISSILLASDEI